MPLLCLLPMIIYFDARFARWQSVSEALVAFGRWHRLHAGYCYIATRPALRREIAALCRFLDLDDAYSFVEDGTVESTGATWFDLSARWEPPHAA